MQDETVVCFVYAIQSLEKNRAIKSHVRHDAVDIRAPIYLLQVVVGQVKPGHAGETVDTGRQLAERVVRHVERVDAVLLLALGRRQLLEPILRHVQLYRRLVEVLLDVAHVVLRHVDLPHNTQHGRSDVFEDDTFEAKANTRGFNSYKYYTYLFRRPALMQYPFW